MIVKLMFCPLIVLSVFYFMFIRTLFCKVKRLLVSLSSVLNSLPLRVTNFPSLECHESIGQQSVNLPTERRPFVFTLIHNFEFYVQP